MLREILEGSGKWKFTAKDLSLSYMPTISTSDETQEISIGWNKIDNEWFGHVTRDDETWAGSNEKDGWQDLAGPQGDYSSLEFSSANLPDVVKAVKKTFKVKVDKNELQKLVNFVVGI
jgi:hypothetical protein